MSGGPRRRCRPAWGPGESRDDASPAQPAPRRRRPRPVPNKSCRSKRGWQPTAKPSKRPVLRGPRKPSSAPGPVSRPIGRPPRQVHATDRGGSRLMGLDILPGDSRCGLKRVRDPQTWPELEAGSLGAARTRVMPGAPWGGELCPPGCCLGAGRPQI